MAKFFVFLFSIVFFYSCRQSIPNSLRFPITNSNLVTANKAVNKGDSHYIEYPLIFQDTDSTAFDSSLLNSIKKDALIFINDSSFIKDHAINSFQTSAGFGSVQLFKHDSIWVFKLYLFAYPDDHLIVIGGIVNRKSKKYYAQEITGSMVALDEELTTLIASFDSFKVIGNYTGDLGKEDRKKYVLFEVRKTDMRRF